MTINKGGTVSYTNYDAIKHNVSSPNGLFRSELADGGPDGAGGRGGEARARYVRVPVRATPEHEGPADRPVMCRAPASRRSPAYSCSAWAPSRSPRRSRALTSPTRSTAPSRRTQIEGGRGEDKINGLGGDDTLDGNGDNDVIKGGDGNDKLFGAGCEVGELGRICDNVGRDRLHGRAGDDDLRANECMELPDCQEATNISLGTTPDRRAGERQAARRREARRAARGREAMTPPRASSAATR